MSTKKTAAKKTATKKTTTKKTAVKKAPAKKSPNATAPEKAAKPRILEPAKTPSSKRIASKRQNHVLTKPATIHAEVSPITASGLDNGSGKTQVMFKEVLLPVLISIAKKYGPTVIDEVIDMALRSTRHPFAIASLKLLKQAVRAVSHPRP